MANKRCIPRNTRIGHLPHTDVTWVVYLISSPH